MGERVGSIRVQILSDLHREVAPERALRPEDVDTGADIVVVAGDMDAAAASVGASAALFPTTEHLVTVAGNHEHYRTGLGIDDAHGAMRRAAAEASRGGAREVLFLEDGEAVLDVRGTAVRVLGCTLWTDYAFFGDPARDAARVSLALNDYRLIRGEGGGSLRPAELMWRHATSRAFLGAALARPHDGPTIVVTHHLPAARSVSKRFRQDRVTAGFASRLEGLLDAGPTLWIHGHTHDSCLWRHDEGTLVACNPAGYPMLRDSRENRGFDPRLVVDIRRGGPDGAWRAGKERTPG